MNFYINIWAEAGVKSEITKEHLLTMHTIPSIEIQSDALQVCLEKKEGKIIKESSETVWLRLGKNSFNLKVSTDSMIDEEHGMKLSQKENTPTVYTLNYKDVEPFDMVFPSSHSVLNTDKQPSLTCICAMPHMYVLGTSDGSLIKCSDPISININKFVLKKNAHFADITHVMSFSSGIVLLTVGLDMLIKIWKNDSLDSDFGNSVRVLKGVHKGRITGCIMIGKGRNIVSCGQDGQIVFWELGSCNAIWRGRRIRNLHDGCTCLCVSSHVSEKDDDSNDLFFECGGKSIWCGHNSGIISVWDCSTRLSLGEITTNKDGFGVEKIEFLERPGKFVVGLSNGDIVCFSYDLTQRKAEKIWQVNVEQPETNCTISVRQMKVCGESSVVILTDNSFVRLSSINGQLLNTFAGLNESISDFCVRSGNKVHKIVAVGKRGFISTFRLVD